MSAVMSIPATSSSDPSGLPVPAPVDADAFRRAVGHFATGVTVVTARVDGIDHAMTASAFTSVSLDPVLVLVCVDKEARFRDAVLESGQWECPCCPSRVARRRMVRHQGSSADRPAGPVPHRRGRVTDVALLDGAVAWLEVRSTAVYDGGDHDIVVGEVIDVAIGDRDAAALAYHRGHYGHLP